MLDIDRDYYNVLVNDHVYRYMLQLYYIQNIDMVYPDTNYNLSPGLVFTFIAFNTKPFLRKKHYFKYVMIIKKQGFA